LCDASHISICRRAEPSETLNLKNAGKRSFDVDEISMSNSRNCAQTNPGTRPRCHHRYVAAGPRFGAAALTSRFLDVVLQSASPSYRNGRGRRVPSQPIPCPKANESPKTDHCRYEQAHDVRPPSTSQQTARHGVQPACGRESAAAYPLSYPQAALCNICLFCLNCLRVLPCESCWTVPYCGPCLTLRKSASPASPPTLRHLYWQGL
jgi:hypothetical protein